MSSIWHSGWLTFDRGLALKDRFVGTDVAVCTISCKKKIFEKQHNYACTLTAITWLRCGPDPPANFVSSVFRNVGARAFLREERRYSGGVEKSACGPIWDVNCPSGPSPRKQ